MEWCAKELPIRTLSDMVGIPEEDRLQARYWTENLLKVPGADPETMQDIQQRLSDFDIGGMSGSSLPVIAGSSIGGARRTFPVRAFPVGVLRGTRAAVGALEYRIPAVRGGRGIALPIARHAEV